MGDLAATDAWRFQFHPEVWLTIAAVVGLGFYVVRVVAPVAVGAGTAAVTRRQRLCFFAGTALLWVSADWPMHDIAEEYLYSVHMVQHLLISFVVPRCCYWPCPSGWPGSSWSTAPARPR